MTNDNSMSRRKFLKYLLGTALFTGVGTFGYSHFIERFWVNTHRMTLKLPRLPKAFNGMRILHFSDLHLGYHYEIDDLSKLVDQIQSVHPDMICFTGDLVDRYYEHLNKIIPVLSSLTAPLGKYAVLGNHDYWIDRASVPTALTDSGFNVLMNSHTKVERNGENIYVTGVEDVLQGNPNIEKAIEGIPQADFKILLAHEPDYADTANQYPIDLQLSGHSHGGQIRLPFFGHLITPPMGSKYVDRLNQAGELTVYTNRGIGTTILPYRFNCRPEISVLELTV